MFKLGLEILENDHSKDKNYLTRL